MAKLTAEQFVTERLGGASQYNVAAFQTQLGIYITRATASLDRELAASQTTFNALDAYGQGVYNRVAGDLVWLQLRVPPTRADSWESVQSQIEDALPVDTTLIQPQLPNFLVS